MPDALSAARLQLYEAIEREDYSEAARLMMGYAASTLGVRRFVAKILEHNAPSLKLFERLGFKEFARVPVFREVHMERILDEAGLAEAAGWLGAAQIGSYDVG